MKEPLYHIVARNKLTGIREPFSKKGTKKEIQDILLQLRLTPSAKRPFTNPKIEVVTPTQTELCFKGHEDQTVRKESLPPPPLTEMTLDFRD